jgi:hypothetical protein
MLSHSISSSTVSICAGKTIPERRPEWSASASAKSFRAASNWVRPFSWFHIQVTVCGADMPQRAAA